MAEMRKDNVTVNNDNIDEKEKQQGTDSPANDETTEKIGVGKKISSFFNKNGKKIGVGIGIAAAFAGGIAADKFGLPKFGKNDPDDQPTE